MEWKDIDSAPKDGTEIILKRGSRVTSGSFERWADTESHYDSAGNYLGRTTVDCGEYWCSYDGCFCDDEHPTHWMPLPEA